MTYAGPFPKKLILILPAPYFPPALGVGEGMERKMLLHFLLQKKHLLWIFHLIRHGVPPRHLPPWEKVN